MTRDEMTQQIRDKAKGIPKDGSLRRSCLVGFFWISRQRSLSKQQGGVRTEAEDLTASIQQLKPHHPDESFLYDRMR